MNADSLRRGPIKFQETRCGPFMPRSHIRLLKSHEDFLACERIQKAVWGALAASTELLSVTQKYGGVVLGAAVEGRLVGFLYAFLARRHGRLVHWSHMM